MDTLQYRQNNPKNPHSARRTSQPRHTRLPEWEVGDFNPPHVERAQQERHAHASENNLLEFNDYSYVIEGLIGNLLGKDASHVLLAAGI
jgi:hypothetical protein